MANPSDKKSLLIILSVLLLVASSTYLISFYARGYKINFNKGVALQATGLLSATSRPKSASVYVNDRLITATDDTINLPPGDYTIRIAKDGYLPWEKQASIKKEIVFQTDAQLYRSVPDLRPVTLSGAISSALSPDGSKIVYAVASASADRDNGLYQFDLNDNPIPLSRSSYKQLAPNFPGVDWSEFSFEFSPDGRSILATNKISNVSYLISLDSPINSRNLFDVTPRLSIIRDEWQREITQNNLLKIEKLPKEIKAFISTDSAKAKFYFNTADEKVLYLAQTEGQIAPNIITPPPAQSTQTQTRDIKAGHYYVYDIKDDTNFHIGSEEDLNKPFWLPNSNSIIYLSDKQIKVIEYDATNHQILFAGNFNPDYVFPWADGSRIVTLIAPYEGAPENLYAISIR
ncbi:MAG: PEGA domain-containing protein [Patescibacteria group bacterium]|jgi:hypothetical protein